MGRHADRHTWHRALRVLPRRGLPRYTLIGLLVGVLLGAAWQKFTSGKHPGMSAHVVYWVLGSPQPKKLPSSDLRELNG
ncbi:type IV conjugative transfer system protein TraL [Burkholderia glumae]|uniref:type IV conjugative transfer system protein TraL n=1 Tax=Burkholderia glumae TaxID=337 RepID=UPI003B9B62C8